MLYVTAKAAEMVALSAHGYGCAGQALRISAFRDEAGKVQYRMGFDDQEQPGDSRWESNGVAVVVPEHSRELLEHVVLDFQDLPHGGPQFAFIVKKDKPEA